MISTLVNRPDFISLRKHKMYLFAMRIHRQIHAPYVTCRANMYCHTLYIADMLLTYTHIGRIHTQIYQNYSNNVQFLESSSNLYTLNVNFRLKAKYSIYKNT